MLASTTITFFPENFGGRGDRHSPAGSAARVVEHFVHCRRGCLLDQPAAEVLLQRLMRCRRSLTQHGVGVIRNVLDLHTGHGAIMALPAPFRER